MAPSRTGGAKAGLRAFAEGRREVFGRAGQGGRDGSIPVSGAAVLAECNGWHVDLIRGCGGTLASPATCRRRVLSSGAGVSGAVLLICRDG